MSGADATGGGRHAEAERSGQRDRGGSSSFVRSVEDYARSLAKIDLTFLAIRDELYGGSWQEIEKDLRARLEGKPFIFKLATRIEEDLERIERLRQFEREHGVDLLEVALALELEPPV